MNKPSKKSKLQIPKSLFFFGLISFLFWMLIKLSRTYEDQQKFTIEYINLPSNKLLQNEPLKETDITLEASGFKLLASKFASNKIILDLALLRKKSNETSYILVSNQKNSIKNQLQKGVEVSSFSNDTIYFNFGYLATKKIPIKPNYTIKYKSGYDLSDSIKFEPDSITISGPERTIDTIKLVNLEFLELTDVDENIIKEIKVKQPQNLKNVSLKDSFVVMKANVEKFTEGEVEIPFTILNVPENLEINTFPKTIKVVFKVGLSNFNNVNANSFSVTCDYKYAQDNSLSYLIPKLNRTSEFSSNEKIVPDKIDFLISK